MTDIESLLKAAAATPTDSLLRCALADALEEMGLSKDATDMRHIETGMKTLNIYQHVVNVLGCAGTFREFLSCIGSARVMVMMDSVNRVGRNIVTGGRRR